jgi:hypothetical protein
MTNWLTAGKPFDAVSAIDLAIGPAGALPRAGGRPCWGLRSALLDA